MALAVVTGVSARVHKDDFTAATEMRNNSVDRITPPASRSADAMTSEQAAAEILRSTPISSLFISLHARIAGERDLRMGSELNYPEYRRKRVDRGTNGQWPEQVRLDFAQGTTIECVEAWYFGISHSETGELLYSDLIHPRIAIAVGVTPILMLPIRAITMLGAHRGTVENPR